MGQAGRMVTETQQDWSRVAAVQEVIDAEMVAIEVDERKILICHYEGEFYATDNVCTHAYALLSDGWLDQAEIECPLHGGRFDIRSGKALTSPVECDLATYELRVVDGYIELKLPTRE